MTKLRVLLVVPRFNIGGAETYVANLASILNKRGYHVVIASGGGRLTKIAEQQNIKHYFVPIRLNVQIASWMLKKIIAREKINIIHANSEAAGLAAALACQHCGVPWVMTAHGIFVDERKSQDLKQADRIIGVSEFTYEFLKKHANIAEEKLRVIHNGINIDEFKFKNNLDDGRKKFGIDKNNFVVGIVARILSNNGKGHNDLCEIMVKSPENWRLLIVGKGNIKSMLALQLQIKRLGISHKVIFAGHRLDVSNVLQAVDVLTLPSAFENFPLSLLEGMAMSKPVIAYAVGGIEEQVDDGSNGFLLKKGDIKGFAEKLNYLYCNPNMSAIMGERGALRVRQDFRIDTMVDKVIAVYNEVLEEGR